jgi:hypothetical protein
MAERNQEPPAHREHIAIGRRDLLRGAAAAGIATHSGRGNHRETDEDLAREMEE